MDGIFFLLHAPKTNSSTLKSGGPQALSDITRDPGPRSLLVLGPDLPFWVPSFHRRTAGEKTKENRTKVPKRKGTISKEAGLTSSNFQPIRIFQGTFPSSFGAVFFVQKVNP